MRSTLRATALAGATTLALGLTFGSTPARRLSLRAGNPWGNYATSRAAPWNAYANRPSAWSNYVYRGTASSGLSAAGAADLSPRHVAYGYRFNPSTSHWEHPGYGGRIPNYGHAGRGTPTCRTTLGLVGFCGASESTP